MYVAPHCGRNLNSKRVIDLAVQSGAYQNSGEVIDQAIEIIREQLDPEDRMFGRQDITPLPVRFRTLSKFFHFAIVYRPDTAPL